MSEQNRIHRDLEQLKKQAKDLLRSANSGDTSTIKKFAQLDLHPASDGRYRLAHAQLVIARGEGFESWQKLRDHIGRESESVFFESIRRGGASRVRQLIREFPQLVHEREASTKLLPVQLAAAEGRLEIVELLVEAGANPTEGNRPARMETHALRYAERRGHGRVVSFIREWLAKRRGYTPEGREFFNAIEAGDITLVSELLQKIPSLANASGFGEGNGFPGGDPVLFAAIRIENPECIELLIKRGASLRARCRRGRTPVQATLGYLLGVGYRPGLDTKADVPKRLQIAQILLDAGAERDLWVKCCMGDMSGVRAAIDSDPDAVNRTVNASQVSGGVGMDHYPLTGAVGGRQFEIAKLLLEHGADPNTPFRLKDENHLDHGAPMEIAVRNGDVEMVKLLLSHGASPNTSRHACSNAVQTAIDSGNDELLELLLSKGGVVGFDVQLKMDWTNIQNRLLQEAYLDADQRLGMDLIAKFIGSATFHGLPHVLKTCLDRVKTIPPAFHFELFENVIGMWSIYIGNVKGSNAGHYFECMDLLLDFGLDPNAVNGRGETCLHRLVSDTPYPDESCRIEFAKKLLEKGGDPARVDQIVSTSPVDLATRNGFDQLHALLVARE